MEYELEKYEEGGINSLYSYRGTKKGYEEDYSFLMGYSGIGLSLLVIINNDVTWTVFLLMD